MTTLVNTFGQEEIGYNNILERRKMVNGMITRDRENGISTTQKPKYDKPYWAFVAGLLNGSDAVDTNALTCRQISEKLIPHYVYVDPKTIYSVLQSMIHLKYSIRRDIRAIGQSCFEIVKLLGSVKTTNVIVTNEDDVEYTIKAYFFGETQSEVIRLRKVLYEVISAKPRP